LRRITYRIGLVQALVLSLAGCSRTASTPVTVQSLRESLPALVDAASLWRADAYLAGAQVALRDGYPGPRLIDAEFNSPTENDESLWVKLDKDGTVTTEVVPHTVAVIQIEPITNEDWALGSPEALESALDEEARRFLEDLPEINCSFLSLERDARTAGSPVVWRLTLMDCLGRSPVQHTILDAITGDVIRRNVYGVVGTPTP
jgi:hypothetical protein